MMTVNIQKTTIKGAVCLLLAFVGACVQEGDQLAQEVTQSTPPNIVLILADDLGLGDLGCYNSASKVPTPYLDGLAAQGMRFSDAHSPSAVCTPTRYGLLTGRYCWRSELKSGVLGGESPNLIKSGRLTLPAMLKKAGYVTAGIGKWHLGLGVGKSTDWSKPLIPGPLDHGFDSFFGIPASLDMSPYVYVVDRGLEAAATETVQGSQMVRRGGGGFWRGGAIAPGFTHAGVLPRVTEEAVAFLKERGTKPSPFFLYWALPAPHTPWLPAEKFRGKSGAGVYGDFVAMVDAAVGQALAQLESSGLAENTVVIFTSDNGAHWTMDDIAKFGHRANAQRRGQKADIWEGGHRVPFVVRWPGHVKAGVEEDSLLCLTDVMATLANLVGENLSLGSAEDSVNQAEVWWGSEIGTANPRRDIIHHSFRGHFAIRSGDWKLVERLGSGGFTQPHKPKPTADGPTGQLYNLAVDPLESKNLFLDEPEKVAELQALLNEYRASGWSREGK